MSKDAIAALLRRAKTAAPTETAPPAWSPGMRVELAIAGLDSVHGRFAFIEGDWLYWMADDGHVHATVASTGALRRM